MRVTLHPALVLLEHQDLRRIYRRRMSDVTLSSSGPPETVLPAPPADVVARLASSEDREAVGSIVAMHPTLLEGWARAGILAERSAESRGDQIIAYALFRVGYHRGLDQLRKSGWKGSGYVPWKHPSNRGFLACLDGLGRMAGRIGETEEAERCQDFLRMLDPEWPPTDQMSSP